MDLARRYETRATVQTLLDAAGCAVLLGPPGIGKRALAASSGPSAWVDLGDAQTGGELQSALACTLGCPTDREGAVREALRSVAWLGLDAAEGVLESFSVRRTLVRPDRGAFAAPDGTQIDLGRRRVLAALAQSDTPPGVTALCEGAWPGDNRVGDSGTRRVRVAISTLRGMGLWPAIATVSHADGSTAWKLTATAPTEGT